VVAGSNPVSPTEETRSDQCRSGFFCFSGLRWIGASVPSDAPVGQPSPEKRGASGAQILALSVGLDRQRYRRIMAVPSRDDVHWNAAGQRKADALVLRSPLEVDTAQADALAQALELVGVPLMADGGAVLAYRDQTVIGPASTVLAAMSNRVGKLAPNGNRSACP
jgi:hypothetical protein